ncbi:hypothetical protein Tsubulata_004030 [Turnera subulata]|uniref:F-box domain-containing protein n=1 Tax=Turnera subulata TaxID=218843 RepID=A0A9Q0GB47_9ROSI|nr:hypothetical protein Tsubulata_004030 [Turnera subulata]
MESSRRDLPMDVIEEILCRIPPKFVVKFKLVSKPWRDLISSASFIKRNLHHSRSSNNTKPKYLFPVNFGSTLALPGYHIHYKEDNESLSNNIISHRSRQESRLWLPPLTKYNNVFLPLKDEGYYMDFIVGSCDGLVLGTISGKNMLQLLWNPMTRECRELPCVGETFFPLDVVFGFCYDPCIEDHKLILPIVLGDRI